MSGERDLDSPLLDALRAHSGAGFIDDTSGVSFREAAQIIGDEKHAVSFSIKRVENCCADALHLLSAAAGLCTVAPMHSRWSGEEQERFRARLESLSSLARGGVWVATSGSTGEPKIAPLLPDRIIAHADAVNSHLDASEGDCWLLCLPLFHVGGFAILPRAVLAGSTVRLTNGADAETLNAIIDSEPITMVSLVPTMLRRVLEARQGRPFPSRLRAILLGGGPVSRDLIETCPQVLATYGMTEAGSMVTCVARDANAEERVTAGRVIQGSAVRIVDDEGNDQLPDVTGRILIRSRGMADEYVGDAGLSGARFYDGWCVTEDAGYLTESGHLVVLGRLDRIVVSGGENIALDEVESALHSLAEIKDAMCVGVENEEWGQAVGAVVVVERGVTQRALTQQLAMRLGSHKLPKLWRIVDEIPLLANGKPDYAAAKAMLADD